MSIDFNRKTCVKYEKYMQITLSTKINPKFYSKITKVQKQN